MRPSYFLPLTTLLLSQSVAADAATWFGRDVVRLAKPKDYSYFELDDVKHPFIAGKKITVACTVYRGESYYYVQLGLENRSDEPIEVPRDLLAFDKPKYTVFRLNSLAVAQDLWGESQGVFVAGPTPPAQTKTEVTGSTTTFGSTSTTRAEATTTSGPEPGAALGYALGTVFARRRFEGRQRDNQTVASFLAACAQETNTSPIEPGESRIVTAVFRQTKPKRAPFNVRVRIAGEEFAFDYRE